MGRDLEKKIVGGFLGDLRGGGGTLLLSGDAGVGKTEVLRWAARANGLDVLKASGVPSAAVSYSALQRPLTMLSQQRTLLSAGHRNALDVALGDGRGPPPGLLTISEAFLELLRRSAMRRPVLFVVDDLQWVDPASSRVLGLLARRLAGSRVGLLAAFRAGKAGFFERSGLPQHEVAPLDAAGAATLLDSRYPDLGKVVRERVLGQARGIPLALIELPTALVPAQRSGRAEVPDVLPLTGRLQEIYASAVHRLDPAARRLLLIAALDGSEDLRVQLDAAGADLDAYSSAEQAGFVHVDVGSARVNFRHPLIRAAVVDLATDPERRAAHTALAASGRVRPDQRAWHLSEAAEYPDEAVAGQLELAGRRLLRRGDAVAAVRTLLLAGDLTPDPTVRRRRLAEAAYVGADVTGGLRDVAALVEQGRPHESSPDSPPVPTVATALATAYLLLNDEGDVATAHRLLTAALETDTNADINADAHINADADTGAEAGDPEGAVLEALYTLQLVCFFSGRAAVWPPFADALARLGDRVPLTMRLTSRTFPDPVRTAAPALPELDAAIADLGRETDPSQIVRIGIASFYVDRLPGCRHALWRVVQDGRSGGALASAIDALILLAYDDFVTGQWDDAETLSDEALSLCEVQGYRLLSWPGRLVPGLIAAARGEDEVARSVTDDMLDWARARGVRAVEFYAHHVAGSAALGRGNAELAYQHVAAVSPPGSFPSHVAHALPVAMDLVEAAVRSGRHEEAAAHVRAMQDAGISRLSPRLAFLTAGAEALAASPERSTVLFHRAFAQPGATTWPFEYARLRLAFGEHLRREGHGVDARRQLLDALQIFTRLGARPWALRAATAARAAGRPTPQLLTLRPDRLSQQEHEVVRLAAAGLTNREIGQRLFLSHRTVGAHLYRAFPKLGVTSRAALRDALAALAAVIEGDLGVDER